jgi:hypothetical protein
MTAYRFLTHQRVSWIRGRGYRGLWPKSAPSNLTARRNAEKAKASGWQMRVLVVRSAAWFCMEYPPEKPGSSFGPVTPEEYQADENESVKSEQADEH